MWDNIIGHEENKEFLQRFLQREERPHALLFYGQEGIGKKLLAQNFAESFLCLSEENIAPCRKCESCRLLNIREGQSAHPDYSLIEPDSKGKLHLIKKEQIHELVKQAAFGAVLSRNKICIIDAADTMTGEAANAFLKLLEEPGENRLFILIAESVSSMLPTILSRVIKVRFTPLSHKETEKVLLNQGMTPEEAVVYAGLAGGSPGRALTFKKRDALVLRQTAMDYLGAFPLSAPLLYLYDKDYMTKLLPENEDLQLFLQLTENILRDMLCMKLYLPFRVFNRDVKDRLGEMSEKISEACLRSAMEEINRVRNAAKRRANSKSILDDLTLTLNLLYKGRL